MAPSPRLKVLFLCTGNSARSILGEHLLRSLASERVTVASAGARPTGRVHPMALRVLSEVYGIDASGARSKSVEDLGGQEFDLVITVCDSARQSCPIWPQATAVAHWGFPDPAAADGTEEEVFEVFRTIAEELHRRLKVLCSLPLEEMDRDQIEARARKLAPAAAELAVAPGADS